MLIYLSDGQSVMMRMMVMVVGEVMRLELDRN